MRAIRISEAVTLAGSERLLIRAPHCTMLAAKAARFALHGQRDNRHNFVPSSGIGVTVPIMAPLLTYRNYRKSVCGITYRYN